MFKESFVFLNRKFFLQYNFKRFRSKISKIKKDFNFASQFNDFVGKKVDKKQTNCDSEVINSSKDNLKRKNKKDVLLPLQYKGELLFGIHPVYLALLKKKRTFFQLFLRTDKDEMNSSKKKEIEVMALELNLPITRIGSKRMKYFVSGAVHQGVCLDTVLYPLIEWSEPQTEYSNKNELWLVLDEILDPMNVGAVIRSAHYFGVTKIFVVKDNCCKLSPTVSKASSGALEVVDIYQLDNLEHFLKLKRFQGWNVISTVTYCENQQIPGPIRRLDEINISKPGILILGNEGRGVRSEIQMLCDSFVSIEPQGQLHPGMDSLNVSVAAGVILYSLSKRRQTD